MLELKINEIQALEPIEFNYEDLKASLTESLDKYKNLVYTEDNIKQAEKDRALLNKVSKAINEEKKKVKNKVLEPYTDFENKCKELMEMVDTVSADIDRQVKEFEKAEKDTKLQEILEYWVGNSGEYCELVDADKLIQKEWLNKTTSMSKVHDAIDHIIVRMKTDFSVLENCGASAEDVTRLKDFYINNISSPTVLSLTMQEKDRIAESNKKIENSQNITMSTQNVTEIENNSQKTQENLQNNEEMRQIDFRVWVTAEQIAKLKEFLISNNIKYGKVN